MKLITARQILLSLLVGAGVVASMENVAADNRTVHVTLALVCDIYEMAERNGRGGFARLAGAINAERSRTSNLIVAHAGDTLSPSLFSGIDKGAHIIALTNMIAPDVFVPGNHEFDFGEPVYRRRIQEARFPILAANLRSAGGTQLPGHQDVKHFVFDGVKIAVIGLAADNSPEKSSPGTLRFDPIVPSAKRLAQKLRAEGADIIIAVAHASRRQDLRLFYSHALDVLLSGDDHDLAVLYDGHTAMVEAMADGEFVIAIDLEVTIEKGKSGTRSVRWRPRFRIIDTADVEPDPKVAARVRAFQKTLSKELDVPIGRTATKLDSGRSAVRSGEAAIGNLITDAMRERMRADIAIMNGGGIRGNKTYGAGRVLTRRDILTELPFGNKLFLVEMTGADLLKALENGVWFVGKPNGRFSHVSGATVHVLKSAVPGSRIKRVQVGGKPLDADKRYTVATNDFIAAGKEGYDIFRSAKPLVGATDAALVANVVMDFIHQKGVVSPKIQGRIIVE